MQSVAGPSVITKLDSEGETDPYLEAEWCTDECTPEEIKQHGKGMKQHALAYVILK